MYKLGDRGALQYIVQVAGSVPGREKEFGLASVEDLGCEAPESNNVQRYHVFWNKKATQHPQALASWMLSSRRKANKPPIMTRVIRWIRWCGRVCPAMRAQSGEAKTTPMVTAMSRAKIQCDGNPPRKKARLAVHPITAVLSVVRNRQNESRNKVPPSPGLRSTLRETENRLGKGNV